MKHSETTIVGALTLFEDLQALPGIGFMEDGCREQMLGTASAVIWQLEDEVRRQYHKAHGGAADSAAFDQAVHAHCCWLAIDIMDKVAFDIKDRNGLLGQGVGGDAQ